MRVDTRVRVLSLVNELRIERNKILQEIEHIDRLCRQFGITLPSQPHSVQSIDASPSDTTHPLPIFPPTAQVISIPAHVRPEKKRRTRGVFAKTAEQSLLDFITSSPEPVTKDQIYAHWKAEGRAGKPDSALSKLIKSGKLEREQDDPQHHEPPDEEFDPDSPD